jgi:8-oxo-dGTP diphosphatase
MKQQIHVAIDGVVETNRTVLLLKREIAPFVGYWVLPGGAVRNSERLVDGVKREVKEETGLKVKVVKYIGYYDNPKRDSRKRVITHAFICEPVVGKLKGSFEGRKLKWFKKLPKKMGFDHRKIIKDSGVLK